MKSKILGLLAVGLLSVPVGVNAGTMISGSISLTGFFDCPGTCFATGSTSIVSQLNLLVSDQPAIAGGGFGDYAGSGGFVTPIRAIDLLASPPSVQPLLTLADGTQFMSASIADIIRGALACTGGACSDSLEFKVVGSVTRPGFDMTPSVLRWTGQGSCLGGVVPGGVATCTSVPTASWSASLSSPESLAVPEPGSLALLGLGLAGLGLSRRRKAD